MVDLELVVKPNIRHDSSTTVYSLRGIYSGYLHQAYLSSDASFIWTLFTKVEAMVTDSVTLDHYSTGKQRSSRKAYCQYTITSSSSTENIPTYSLTHARVYANADH